MNKHAELDALYSDIGDLATGNPAYNDSYDFDRIYLREFLVKELHLLHTGMAARTRPHQHIIRAVQMACSVDVNQLTDGDFMLVMAHLRKRSFPEIPVRAEYTCMNKVYTNDAGKIGPGMGAADAKRLGYTLKPCGYHQVETVHQTSTKVTTLEDDDNKIQHPQIDFPRVGTLTDFYEYVGDNPRMKYVGELARWVKSGKTFKAKLAYLLAQPDMKLFQDIEKLKDKYFHGVTEVVRLRCSKCGNIMMHESSPSMLKFFADNTEKDVYNMMYNLMSQFHVATDLNTPVRMFLYLHQTLAQARKEEQQKFNQRQSANPILGTPRKR